MLIVAINPLDKNLKVPVYFANFVLMDYGFGAIFGSAGHDQRDLDFARKYNLDVIPVVKPVNHQGDLIIKNEAYTVNENINLEDFFGELDTNSHSLVKSSQKTRD